MESQTTAINSVFSFDQLHLQFQLLHFGLAYGKSFLRFCAIFFILLKIFFGRDADDMFMCMDATLIIFALFINNDDLLPAILFSLYQVCNFEVQGYLPPITLPF